MKFDRYKAFPYPVLRPYSDDYIESEFQATVDLIPEEHKIIIDIDYVLSSPEIYGLIKQNKAEFISVISCRDTYFQSTVSSVEKNQVVELRDGELRGEVLVNSYVVAKTIISDFQAGDINPEFEGSPIHFHEGDVLAQEETQAFFIDRDYFKPLTSVFDLVVREGLSESEWGVNFEEEHVQIELSTQSKESIDNARNVRENQVILINSIYFSTVMQAIQKLKDSDSKIAYENKKWAKIILGQAHNQGFDIDNHDSYFIAEKLMQHPFGLLRNYIFKGIE